MSANCVYDMTFSQLVLQKWILYYESIYEMDSVERPPDKIISDDERLDAWKKRYDHEIESKLRQIHKDKTWVDRGVPKASIYEE